MEGGYEQMPVYLAEDIEYVCGRNHVGCVLDEGIVISALDAYANLGCTVLTHEYFHILGYVEQEIPKCLPYTWRIHTSLAQI